MEKVTKFVPGAGDPKGLLASASPASPVHLELGSRGNKRNPAAIGIDLLPGPGVDVQGDVIEVLKVLPPQSVGSVYSEHFLEHIVDLEGLLSETSRVLSDGGKFRAIVPHFSNPYFYSDPTHKRFFGLYTFCYLAESDLFRRTTPNYDTDYGLRLDSVRLGFKASRPFYLRHAFRTVFGRLVNANRTCQELYEDLATGLVSCYEVDYALSRVSRQATH